MQLNAASKHFDGKDTKKSFHNNNKKKSCSILNACHCVKQGFDCDAHSKKLLKEKPQ